MLLGRADEAPEEDEEEQQIENFDDLISGGQPKNEDGEQQVDNMARKRRVGFGNATI